MSNQTNFTNQHYRDAIDLLSDLQKTCADDGYFDARGQDMKTAEKLLSGDAASVTSEELEQLHGFMNAVDITAE